MACAATLVTAATVRAQHLVPGADEPGFDAELADKADGHERLIHAVMTPSLGWGLEAFVADEANRALIDDFVASGERDFRAQTGKHVYEVLDDYGEHGDLGMFGGVQAAGDAFRYVVLRDEGGKPAEVDIAREHLLRALDGLHWYTQVTGAPGVFARGIYRIRPETGEPPLPGEAPMTTPLADADGNPLPADKGATWRKDQSGELPFLIWLDDTSKDQFIGYVMALGAVYDAIAEDEAFDCALVDRLAEDARAIAGQLMIKRKVEGGETDLVLMDADGRPTSFHDLSGEEITPGFVLSMAANPFNALMSAGAMRTFYHMSGDPEIGRYYYEELIAARGYLELASKLVDIIYTNENTNHSNVNMGFVAIWGLLRYESDPDVAALTRVTLDRLYASGKDREPRGKKQSFFDFMYAGFRSADAAETSRQPIDEGLDTLRGHPPAPYWNVAVENCDPDELAAKSCTGIDGTPIEVADTEGWKGLVVAVDPLPMEIRPPSNFEWRSDPHRVNGTASSRLNPAGDFHAAYWLGRMLRETDDGLDNISAIARPRPEDDDGVVSRRCAAAATSSDAGATNAGVDDAGNAQTTASSDDDGCGCRTPGVRGRPPSAALAIFALLVLGWARYRAR